MRLVHPTWAAAVIARLKDEEVLTKRRQPRNEDKPPKTGGRGGKAQPGAPAK